MFMFRLAKLGVLTSIFLDLKDDVPPCASCMFGTTRSRTWRTKVNKSGSIWNDTGNKTGAGVSVHQIQSIQPGLVPQLSGKLTSTHILDSQVMVEHFSDLTYVHLIIGTI